MINLEAIYNPQKLESLFSSKKFKLKPTKAHVNEELVDLPLNSIYHFDNIDDSKSFYSTLILKYQILLVFYLDLYPNYFKWFDLGHNGANTWLQYKERIDLFIEYLKTLRKHLTSVLYLIYALYSEDIDSRISTIDMTRVKALVKDETRNPENKMNEEEDKNFLAKSHKRTKIVSDRYFKEEKFLFLS